MDTSDLFEVDEKTILDEQEYSMVGHEASIAFWGIITILVLAVIIIL